MIKWCKQKRVKTEFVWDYVEKHVNNSADVWPFHCGHHWDIRLFVWYCLCVKLNRRAHTGDCHKKDIKNSLKIAVINCNMTSDLAGLNCELYGLNFAHCELLYKSICACMLWSNCIQVYQSAATNHHRLVEYYLSNFIMVCSSYLCLFLKFIKCVKF